MNIVILDKLAEIAKRAEMYDNQRHGDSRYDEGYADTMYDAIAMIKEGLEIV